MTIESVDKSDVEVYDIDEEGTIFIEKAPDHYTLESGDVFILLDHPYELVDLKVIQDLNNDTKVIEFDNEDQLKYFETLLEEQNNDAS